MSAARHTKPLSTDRREAVADCPLNGVKGVARKNPIVATVAAGPVRGHEYEYSVRLAARANRLTRTVVQNGSGKRGSLAEPTRENWSFTAPADNRRPSSWRSPPHIGRHQGIAGPRLRPRADPGLPCQRHAHLQHVLSHRRRLPEPSRHRHSRTHDEAGPPVPAPAPLRACTGGGGRSHGRLGTRGGGAVGIETR